MLCGGSSERKAKRGNQGMKKRLRIQWISVSADGLISIPPTKGQLDLPLPIQPAT